MYYLLFNEPVSGRALVFKIVQDPWPGMELMEPGGLFFDSIPDPEKKEGFREVMMIKMPEDEEGEPEIYYDYVLIPPPPEPQETQVQRLQRELEDTKKAIEDLNASIMDILLGGE